MREEMIQDWKGKIIGWVRIYNNGDKEYCNFKRTIQARYRADLDITTTFGGRKLENGDAGRSYIVND